MTRTTLAALLLALTSATAAAQTISGSATVTDGDTIRLRDTRIRIAGIDAPEKAQTCESGDGRVYECGRDAAAVMAELIRNRTVTCTPTGYSYNRIVATCSTENGDLGEQMVRRGWAVRVPTPAAMVRHGHFPAACFRSSEAGSSKNLRPT